MENLKQEDLVETTPASEVAPVEETVETLEQDPLKPELEKVKQGGRTEAQKAEHKLREVGTRARELGLDPAQILGITPKEEGSEDDDQPVTRKELQEIISANASKTALQLADEITNETERELVKHYLTNRLQPSGNPQDDLRDARRIVNSIRNEQIATELARKSKPKSHSNGSSGPAKVVETEPELTPQELLFTKPPFNMSKADVLKSRKG